MNLNWLLLIAVIVVLTSCGKKDGKYDGWTVTGGTKEGIRYSTLDQITPENVKGLRVAWEYRTGDADTVNHSQIQCNPIIVDGILFGTSPQLKLVALHAATGKEKWVFDPKKPGKNLTQTDFILNNNRGVTFWTNGVEKRILYVAGSFLHAVNAETGLLIQSFGKEGKVDLHEGLGRDVTSLYVAATSPGIIYKNLIILGTRVSEGTDAAPGHIRAYDVTTGKQQWIFHTIPKAGEFGHDTWEDPNAHTFIGGANSWSGFTMDETRGIVFVPTGSASFDFYGGKRKGSNLFANCLLALDASTGKRKWHYQLVHHDVWDKDLPTAPALVTVTHDGKQIDAVAQPTKTGFIFLLNRETGEPLFEVKEQPVPQDGVEGEKLFPTQPIPVLPEPFSRQHFEEKDLNNLVPDSSYQDILERFRSYKRGHMFTPPSKEGTIFFPGLDGGAEWGGPAVDPETAIMYVNANEMPWVITLMDVQKKEANETNLQAGVSLYQKHCMSCHGENRQGSGNYPTLVGMNNKYALKEFKNLVTTGRRMMPGFAHLSNEEHHAIATYILDLEKEQSRLYTGKKTTEDPSEVPYTITGYNKFLTKEKYPAITPPWGTLSAVNLNTGKLEWRIPLGDTEEFKAQGIQTGTENYGGPLVTKSGLVFIAATRDGKMRGFDKTNGNLLWEVSLPAPGFATPAMYEVNGKQYLVVACGGGKLGTGSGDSYIAFALPE